MAWCVCNYVRNSGNLKKYTGYCVDFLLELAKQRIYSSLPESLKLYRMSHWVKRPDQTSTILESVCRRVGKFKWLTEPSTPLFLLWLHPLRGQVVLGNSHSQLVFISVWCRLHTDNSSRQGPKLWKCAQRVDVIGRVRTCHVLQKPPKPSVDTDKEGIAHLSSYSIGKEANPVDLACNVMPQLFSMAGLVW